MKNHIKKLITLAASAAAMALTSLPAFAAATDVQGFWGTAPAESNAFDIQERYTVTVDFDGGTYNDGGGLTSTDKANGWFTEDGDWKISVTSGKTATALSETPEYSGYTFLTYAESDGTEFVFGTTEVTGNMTVYAVYAKSTLASSSISYKGTTTLSYTTTRSVSGLTATYSTKSSTIASLSTTSTPSAGTSGSSTVTGAQAGSTTLTMKLTTSGGDTFSETHNITVNRIDNTVTVNYVNNYTSKDDANVNYQGTGEYTVTYYGDGTVTATSSSGNLTIGTVSYSGKSATSTSTMATFTVTAGTYFSSTDTVTITVAQGTNYSSASKTDSLSVTAYKVTINMNSGTPTTSSGSYGATGYGSDTWTYGSSTLYCYVPYGNSGVKTPAADPTRSSYYFMGWKTSNVTSVKYYYNYNYAASNNVSQNATKGSSITANTTLYATWTTETLLKTGAELNAIFTSLCGSSSSNYTSKTVYKYVSDGISWSTDSDTKATIRELKVTECAYDSSYNTSYTQVQEVGMPVYAWYSGTTLYIGYDTGVSTVYFNQDSSDLFRSSITLNESGYNFDGEDDYVVPDSHQLYSLYETNGYYYSFANLTSVTVFETVDTSLVTDASYMFMGCKGLESFSLGKFSSATSLTDMRYMFCGCVSLSGSAVANFQTDNVTTLAYCFAYDFAQTSLDVSKWDVSNVTNISSMFKYCYALEEFSGSSWGTDTGNITNMGNTFMCCKSLSSLDFSPWNMSGVTNFGQTLNSCSSVTTIKFPTSSEYIPSAITGMDWAFNGDSSLTSINIADWGFGSANITHAFASCSSLTSLNLSGWNTSKVYIMCGLFRGCSSLTTLKLGSDFLLDTAVTYQFTISSDYASAHDTIGYARMFYNTSASLKITGCPSKTKTYFQQKHCCYSGNTSCTAVTLNGTTWGSGYDAHTWGTTYTSSGSTMYPGPHNDQYIVGRSFTSSYISTS